MHLVFDIFQGIGIASAIGIRPFLPSLAVGALAAGDVEIDFAHTSYSFLQEGPFLLVMFVLVAALISVERSPLQESLRSGLLAATLIAASLALGGTFFAGSLCRGGYAAWPGWVAGVACAGVGVAASRPFLARLRLRLDLDTAAVGMPVLADGSALLIAVLSVVAPPIGLIALLGLLYLLWRGRGRGEAKYAGLRILK